MGSLYRTVYGLNRAWDHGRVQLRRKLGIARPPIVVPHRGFGTRNRAMVRCRVLEDRAPLTFHDRSTFHRLLAAYRRYATQEVPHEPLVIRWNEQTYETRADREGYVDTWVDPPASACEGWNSVEIVLPRYERSQRVEVFVVGPRAEYAVLSDIDDTVIETQATNPLKRAYALFWAEAAARLPFEGVAAFYRALQGGRSGEANNPLLYLSSSPWNLHQHLEELMSIHGIPNGPMLLRDWGFGPTGFAPTGTHRHKIEKATEVFETLDPLPLVLIGDSGQEDAQHYATLVETYPGRVLAVYIRDVGSRRGAVHRHVARIEKKGVPVLLASDTAQAARHAENLGLVRPEEVPAVERDRDEDQERESVVDRLGRSLQGPGAS